MITSREIMNVLHSEKERLNSLGVKSIGLFGSYLRGEADENSDIDILIDLSDDSNMTLFSLIELEQSLSFKFNKKVDLVIRRDLKRAIGEKILSEVVYV
ncbi:MAG TPA: nucleotidyltransferase domain-containing protein [Spirochaetota bacterium]|nr:nucleotidyltransferase domain-containing protein [Spirochaetota bacterium]